MIYSILTPPPLFFTGPLLPIGRQDEEKSSSTNSVYHELVLRGRPLLSMKMVRTRIKGTKISSSPSPADEPQFYSMPFLGPGARPSAQKSVQERNNSFDDAAKRGNG